MTDRVDYLKFSTLVRPEKHSLDEAPFDASAFYDWDSENDLLEDLQELMYGETQD